MRVVILTQYFWPESFRINELVQSLTENGHIVDILTGKPNYPEGKFFSGYGFWGCTVEDWKGTRIYRVPLLARGRKSRIRLVLNYLSFIISGGLFAPGMLRKQKYDVIFVFAPSPITSVIPAILLKYIKRTHLAVWVQDLWPESLSATGFIKNKTILKMVSYLVRGIYACSDTLLVQSEAFIRPVSALSNHDKIIYFPNVIDDMQQQAEQDELNILPEDLNTLLEKHFCLVFAGNIGKAQSIETLIDAAKRLSSFPDIKIVLVGNGSMLEWAQHEVARLQLNNVTFTGAFPLEVMPSIFSKAKGLLVSLKAEEIFSYTIPSKVQAYLSAGRPIIASIDGEAARIIDEAGAGLVCAADNVAGLTERIIQLFNMNQSERDALGNNGRKYFLENFEMKQQCVRLVEILEQRIGQNKGGLK